MEKKFFLGIDGGGTKTELVLLDESKILVSRAVGTASSIDTVSLSDSIKAVQKTFDALQKNVRVSAIFASLGGMTNGLDTQKYADALRSLSFIEDNAIILVQSDVYAALASGKGVLEGMTLILGTGSVCFGIHKGKTWRAGGFHFKEGDAGSAFDLGFQALKYYSRVLDGRYEISEFSTAIKNHLQIENFPDLVRYFDGLDRTKVAQIAPLVTAFAPVNQYAYKILVDAAEEVRMLVDCVYKHLGFDSTTLSIIGGLGTSKTPYRSLFIQNIKKVSSSIEIIEAMYSPAHATALLAKNAFDSK
jgi:N-acetylglucosamine kinase-like BadF-type ATPase